MKALKTIIATAVIVFALTTVAMAGVQRFTKQERSGNAATRRRRRSPPIRSRSPPRSSRS